MALSNWKDIYAYFEKVAGYILDEPDSQDIYFKADEEKVRLCSSFLCGNTSGGTIIFQDNGDKMKIESKFPMWLMAYPDYEKAIPKGVLVNLLHILAKKRNKHGEVAFSPSERDWYDTDESFEEVRNFAKTKLKQLGNPPLSLETFIWFE